MRCRVGEDFRQDLLQGVTRPHGAFAVVAVFEKLGLGRPREHHGLAVEPHAIGKPRSIEHRSLEGLVEAVDVKQHISREVGLGEEVADLRLYSTASRRQLLSPIEAREKRPLIRRREPGSCELTRPARSGPYHGVARAPLTDLRVVVTSTVGLS